MSALRSFVLAASLALVEPGVARSGAADGEHVRGVTISCQTWGREWASDAFAEDLDRLRGLGVNWVAIHPYASIAADGTVRGWHLDPADATPPSEWIERPIREAHARGMSILVIPHIAYWGSPWSWRGAIELADADARARFFASYERWIVAVATVARDADGFSIANELEKLARFDVDWRKVIAAVRAATPARLTWAANWSGYRDVPFWDALDAIGVEAYFPLCERDDPSEDDLRAGWKGVLAELHAFQLAHGKPVVFTELGYRAAVDAAREPWTFRESRGDLRARGEAVQERCLRVALEEIAPHRDWLRGAFLWKWMPRSPRGETHGHDNFLLNRAGMQAVIGSAWKSAAERAPAPR